jgi:hypothetical protein
MHSRLYPIDYTRDFQRECIAPTKTRCSLSLSLFLLLPFPILPIEPLLRSFKSPTMGRMKHLDIKHRVFMSYCRPNASSLHHQSFQPKRCQMGYIKNRRVRSTATRPNNIRTVTFLTNEVNFRLRTINS